MGSRGERRMHMMLGHLRDNGAGEKRGLKVSETSAVRKVKMETDDGKVLETYLDGDALVAGDLAKVNIVSLDPGLANTAIGKSGISFIDGEAGRLTYRGYPIEVLAEKSTFLEVAFLLLNGELPNRDQFVHFQDKVMSHTYVHQDLTNLIRNFRYDAHPMGMFVSAMAALGTFYPDANPALQGAEVLVNDKALRDKQVFRILGKAPTIAACAYRHRIGRPYNSPNPGSRTNPWGPHAYASSFLTMLDRFDIEGDYKPHPKLARALDVLFILHAEHGLNCSTAAVRHISSARTDPYTCISGAAGALYGPFHGGANEAVLRMLERIGDKANVPAFLERVKNREEKLMGFGHRVYKNFDPRSRILKSYAYEVFDLVGYQPLIEVAKELERVALQDPFFVKRKLYPNVDFYSGLIYRSLGFPTDFFPVLFALPRVVGWLAHWVESLETKGAKIMRPKQVYTGSPVRQYVPMAERWGEAPLTVNYPTGTAASRRREISFQHPHN